MKIPVTVKESRYHGTVIEVTFPKHDIYSKYLKDQLGSCGIGLDKMDIFPKDKLEKLFYDGEEFEFELPVEFLLDGPDWKENYIIREKK